MKVEILAVKDKSLFGRLISFVRRSKVSHAAVRVNGWVYEMGLKSPQKLEDHLYRWNYEVIHEVHMAKETFNERLKSMQSAKYDYLAILAFYINRKFGKRITSSPKKAMCVDFVGRLAGIKELDYKLAPDEMKQTIKDKEKA